MSHLAQLMGVNEHEWDWFIKVVHSDISSGAHDVTVLNEVMVQARQFMTKVRLDPSDTLPEELYRSLRSHIAQESMAIAKELNLADDSEPAKVNIALGKWFNQKYGKTEGLYLKNTYLKKQLSQNPPKNLMKLLHYRSVASLLKHVSADQIVTLARYTEDDQWHQQYNESLTTVSPSDFEVRKIKLIVMKKSNEAVTKVLAKTIKLHHLVLHAKEVGCIILSPTNQSKIPHYLIRSIGLISHYVSELQYFSSYTKVIIIDKKFAKRYIDGLVRNHEAHSQLANLPFHWRALSKAIDRAGMHDRFPPQFSTSEWQTTSANDVIVDLNKTDQLWRGRGHVLWGRQPDIVSFNIIDLAIDETYKVDYDGRSLKYGQRELTQEVLSRYLQEPRISHVVMRRLNI